MNFFSQSTVILMAGVVVLSGRACSAWADSAPSLFDQAERAYSRREDIPQAKVAMVLFERAAVAESTRAVEAYWKAARAAWWLGENAENKEERLIQLQNAMNLAQKAIAMDPNSVEGHFWLGAAAGTFGKVKGVLKSLALVKPIRHEMAEVIRINDHFQNGAAYRVLGVVDFKVPALMGGSKSRAKKELDKALSMGTSDPFVHYDFVDFYRTTGDFAKSQTELDVLRHLQVPADLTPEFKMLIRKAEQL